LGRVISQAAKSSIKERKTGVLCNRGESVSRKAANISALTSTVFTYFPLFISTNTNHTKQQNLYALGFEIFKLSG
jgi:hypothetical protein